VQLYLERISQYPLLDRAEEARLSQLAQAAREARAEIDRGWLERVRGGGRAPRRARRGFVCVGT
jgi:hypothetical protein